MIHPISGLYSNPVAGVEKIAAKNTPPAQAKPAGPGTPQDLLARDSVTVASISTLADRSMTYKVAINNLNDIDNYLNELF